MLSATIRITRRAFLLAATCLLGISDADAASEAASGASARALPQPLNQFAYGQVRLEAGLPRQQFEETIAVLMLIDDDAMLKPYRQRAGLPAPGNDVGGWYDNNPHYDWRRGDGRGFAPGHCFGQWLSALSRAYALTERDELKVRVERLVEAYAQAISPSFFADFRFPAYTFDKLVGGLVDAHLLVGAPGAMTALHKTTDCALPHLPETAVDRGVPVRGRDESFTWDESYTLPENLFLAFQAGAGDGYLALAKRFLLDETYFDPLSRNENVLAGKHAYSYVNAFSSAMLAYLAMNSAKHLEAARNGFEMLRSTQSFATGGWGPDELLSKPGQGTLGKSLVATHNSFETPCGSYAHFKVARYLLRATGDSRYGDSMERVLYNTVLGAKHLQPDGRAFYYSDYNFDGKKTFSTHICPCCAGTLTQVACDYAINAYLHDVQGVYVNLYINSTVTWMQDNKPFSLSQKSDYPNHGLIRFQLQAPESGVVSALRFRIPSWAKGALLRVDGIEVAPSVEPGKFAELTRLWKGRVQLELELPLPVMLEAVDAEHPNTVALVRGPQVFFAIKPNANLEKVTRAELLRLSSSEESQKQEQQEQEWLVSTSAGTIKFLPWTSISDECYCTYVQTSQ